jgi:[acyl-carrier-protein] S-malonyltransferase
MRYAVLFPGQGSQFVGMGADVFAARPDLLGESADSILGWSLAGLCASGPEDELTRTDRAQPALYAVSFALWEALRDEVYEPPVGGAGHSLGEYTALAAAGVFDYETGLRLVAARGIAMDRAARAEPSGMAALLGADLPVAEAIAFARRADGGRLWVANLNAPGQIVLAGGNDDIAWLQENARELGARRAIPLKVAGAFHSPLMAAAAADLSEALAGLSAQEARFPVWANVSAVVGTDVINDLTAQLTSTVRFAESLEALAAAGVEAFVHIGPGDVTAGMARRTAPNALVLTVSSLDDVAAAAAALNVQ